MAFPTASLYARHEANLEVGRADGDPLASITDQSGNGRHLTQVSASKQPTWRAAATPGGRPAYRLDGVDDAAEQSSGDIALTGWSVCAVVATGTVAETARAWIYSIHRSTAYIAALEEGEVSPGEWSVFARTDAGTVNQTTAAVDTTQWTTLLLVWDGATVTLYRDGAVVDSDALGGSFLGREVSLGTLTVAPWGGDLALGAVWTKALDATERTALQDYVTASVLGVAGGGGGSAPLPATTETDTPGTLTGTKRGTAPATATTDAAGPLSGAKSGTPGPQATTDAPGALAGAKAAVLPTVTTLDSPGALTGATAGSGALPTVTDTTTPAPLTGAKTAALPAVTILDTPGVLVGVGQAAGTLPTVVDVASVEAFTGAKTAVLPAVSTSDTARPLTGFNPEALPHYTLTARRLADPLTATRLPDTRLTVRRLPEPLTARRL